MPNHKSLWWRAALLAACLSCLVFTQTEEWLPNSFVSSASQAGDQKKDESGQKPKENTVASKEPHRPISLEEKRQQAMLLAEDALAVANGVSPIEFKVLAQVDGAALLWPSDQARARSIFQEAVVAARQFLEEEKKTRVYKPAQSRAFQDQQGRSGRLWFVVLRKIAAVSSALLQELTTDHAKTRKETASIPGDWTEEARATISLAYDQIESDPALAARLAEQTLAQGMIDWNNFLRTLSQRDAGEAERFGALLIDRLRDSSLSPIILRNLSTFCLMPDRSAGLKERLLQALVIRLQRDLRPDITRRQLEDSLITAKDMTSISARVSPRWPPEFQRLALDIERLFKSLALPLPTPPEGIKIEAPPTAATATPGDTNEVRDALTLTDKMADAQARDKQYQKLATDAARKADVKLAEDMLWRISNEELRRETTIEVYSPLVRQALKEADWARAQELALKVADPLGRTLMLNQVGQSLRQAKQKNELVVAVYREAAAHLDRDVPTLNVARAWLLLLGSLFMLAPENDLDPASAAIAPLNKLVSTEDLFKESTFGYTLQTWMTFPTYTAFAGDVLYLPEMLSKAFGELAQQDEARSLKIAAELIPSLRSLAQIAISREMLAKAKSAAQSPPKNAK